MTDQKHSPEPWQLRIYDPEGYNAVEVTDPRGDIVFATDASPSPVDARRIVACVNACAGIPTEELEKLSLASYRDAVEKIADLVVYAKSGTIEKITEVLRTVGKI